MGRSTTPLDPKDLQQEVQKEVADERQEQKDALREARNDPFGRNRRGQTNNAA